VHPTSLNKITSRHISGKICLSGLYTNKSDYFIHRKQVSNHIVEEKWGDTAPPSVKAEMEVDGDFVVIRQLWTAIIRKCFCQIYVLVLIVLCRSV
jgi:hypothetical protein